MKCHLSQKFSWRWSFLIYIVIYCHWIVHAICNAGKWFLSSTILQVYFIGVFFLRHHHGNQCPNYVIVQIHHSGNTSKFLLNIANMWHVHFPGNRVHQHTTWCFVWNDLENFYVKISQSNIFLWELKWFPYGVSCGTMVNPIGIYCHDCFRPLWWWVNTWWDKGQLLWYKFIASK